VVIINYIRTITTGVLTKSQTNRLVDDCRRVGRTHRHNYWQTTDRVSKLCILRAALSSFTETLRLFCFRIGVAKNLFRAPRRHSFDNTYLSGSRTYEVRLVTITSIRVLSIPTAVNWLRWA